MSAWTLGDPRSRPPETRGSDAGAVWAKAGFRPPHAPAHQPPLPPAGSAALPTLQGEQEPQWELRILRPEQRDSPPDPPAPSASERAHCQQLNMIQFSWSPQALPAPCLPPKGQLPQRTQFPMGRRICSSAVGDLWGLWQTGRTRACGP